jgi:hypothetical protein
LKRGREIVLVVACRAIASERRWVLVLENIEPSFAKKKASAFANHIRKLRRT